MEPGDKAAIVNAASAAALIEAMGMMSENIACLKGNGYPSYQKKDFDDIIQRHSIGYNDVIKFIQQ